jgi:hypothetical protein
MSFTLCARLLPHVSLWCGGVMCQQLSVRQGGRKPLLAAMFCVVVWLVLVNTNENEQ